MARLQQLGRVWRGQASPSTGRGRLSLMPGSGRGKAGRRPAPRTSGARRWFQRSAPARGPGRGPGRVQSSKRQDWSKLRRPVVKTPPAWPGSAAAAAVQAAVTRSLGARAVRYLEAPLGLVFCPDTDPLPVHWQPRRSGAQQSRQDSPQEPLLRKCGDSPRQPEPVRRSVGLGFRWGRSPRGATRP